MDATVDNFVRPALEAWLNANRTAADAIVGRIDRAKLSWQKLLFFLFAFIVESDIVKTFGHLVHRAPKFVALASALKGACWPCMPDFNFARFVQMRATCTAFEAEHLVGATVFR